MKTGTRLEAISAERRVMTRRRFLTTALALSGTAGVAALTAGLLGFGSAPTYQQAPIVEHPFTSTDPDSYTGPDAPPQMKPLELAIPAIGVHASLIDVALEPGTDRMIIPSPENVGHYTLAAPIGAAAGATLLAGHVNQADWSPGALWNLSKVRKGAPAYVTNHAGHRFAYKVTSSRTVTRQPLPADSYRTDGPPQLVIVTCAGTPGPDGRVLNYDQNTIITAVPAA